MTDTLNFKEGFWCPELNASIPPGIYTPKDDEEYKTLVKYADVEDDTDDSHDESDGNNPYTGLSYQEVKAEVAKRELKTESQKRADLEAALIADDKEQELKVVKEAAKLDAFKEIANIFEIQIEDADNAETLTTKFGVVEADITKLKEELDEANKQALEAKKQEALAKGVVEADITDADTMETLQAKIDAKKA